MKAVDIKRALRRRHPAVDGNGVLSAWTCVEEWARIDLLAICAWSSWRGTPRYARVGYEVKVSRSDLRRELANPRKRAHAVALCHEFYFAVPAGLLRPAEIEWVAPEGFHEEEAPLRRPPCPGAFGAFCHAGRVAMGTIDRRTRADRRDFRRGFGWRGSRFRGVDYRHRYEGPCPTCRGEGWIVESPAVRAGAPSLWVPDDVGLVVVDEAGRANVVKKAPRRRADGRSAWEGLAAAGITDRELADLVRWVSVRPDPRHAALASSKAVQVL